jgi:putative glutamine amidotransferase
MPVIAIARCSKLPDYETSVRNAGGTPQVIDQSIHADEAIRGAAGLLLAGGGDVDPALYGEKRHKTYAPSEPGRDAYEIELVARALDADIPILAICRGVQLLNVALGGTLIQDIPSQVKQAIEHRHAAPPNPPFKLAHAIDIDTDSMLAMVLRDRLDVGPIEVNSRHHQAIHRPGAGLVVTAIAPDRVTEAVEDPDHPFLIGVQWHPENFWRTGEFARLFEAFVLASGA